MKLLFLVLWSFCTLCNSYSLFFKTHKHVQLESQMFQQALNEFGGEITSQWETRRSNTAFVVTFRSQAEAERAKDFFQKAWNKTFRKVEANRKQSSAQTSMGNILFQNISQKFDSWESEIPDSSQAIQHQPTTQIDIGDIHIFSLRLQHKNLDWSAFYLYVFVKGSGNSEIFDFESQ